jgi:hypothetical protein
MRLLLVWLLLAVPLAAAQESYLAMCHRQWNCKAQEVAWLARGFAITGWLENTFGQTCECADRLLQLDIPKTIRVHLINSPCMRNKRCGRYEVLYNETAASASRKVMRGNRQMMRKFNKVVEAFRRRLEQAKGAVTCYVSPCLECDLYEPARRRLADIVSAAVPSCTIVDSPYRRRCLSGTVCEKHGENPRVNEPCIVDLDGIDGATIDVGSFVERYKSCDITYYWEPWMNCIRGEFKDPRSRNCKYKEEFSSLQGLLCQYYYPSLDICSL